MKHCFIVVKNYNSAEEGHKCCGEHYLETRCSLVNTYVQKTTFKWYFNHNVTDLEIFLADRALKCYDPLL